MNKTILKGLIMTLVGFVAATLSTSLQDGNIDWVYIGIASLGIILTYLGKNAIFQSTSKVMSLNWRDALSGLFVTLGAAISSFAADMIIADVVDYKKLLTIALVTVCGYLAKTFAQTNKQ